MVLYQATIRLYAVGSLPPQDSAPSIAAIKRMLETLCLIPFSLVPLSPWACHPVVTSAHHACRRSRRSSCLCSRSVRPDCGSRHLDRTRCALSKRFGVQRYLGRGSDWYLVRIWQYQGCRSDPVHRIPVNCAADASAETSHREFYGVSSVSGTDRSSIVALRSSFDCCFGFNIGRRANGDYSGWERTVVCGCRLCDSWYVHLHKRIFPCLAY